MIKRENPDIIKMVYQNNKIIEMEIIKTIKPHGNTCYITLPRELKGERVIIYYKKEEKNNGKKK